MVNYTIIGDIHGCFDTFMALLKKIPEGDTVISVGDLVDRGPKSMQVVQYMIDHPEIKVVLANHEEMMFADILGNKSPYTGEWLAYQAKETLNSYKGCDPQLIKDHAKWMSELPLYLEFPETYMIGEDTDMGRKRHLVVSHASIVHVYKFRDSGHPKHNFFKQEATWSRGIPQDEQTIYNVFGHTPCYMEPKVKSFYANIDTGCVYNRTGYAKLTAIRFPSLEIIQQYNIDSDFREL